MIAKITFKGAVLGDTPLHDATCMVNIEPLRKGDMLTVALVEGEDLYLVTGHVVDVHNTVAALRVPGRSNQKPSLGALQKLGFGRKHTAHIQLLVTLVENGQDEDIAYDDRYTCGNCGQCGACPPD